MAGFKKSHTAALYVSSHHDSSFPLRDNGPESLDSIFDDDDDDSEDFGDGSFTMISEKDLDSRVRRLNSDSQPPSQYATRSVNEPNTTDKMKNKIVSFWNNVKYGWSVKPNTSFRKNKPIFLLGKCYDHRVDGTEVDEQSLQMTLIKFRQDFVSRIWFTYRQDFPMISGSQITTDCGWGCMLRSGQMILAQALVTHFLTRNWNLFAKETRHSDLQHREIIRWFSDRPSNKSPFSIHRLVMFGESLGKKAGDWYGPATVATILEKAVKRSSDFVPLLRQVCLYVGHDCTIYKKDVLSLCTQIGRGSISSNVETWRSVILLVPVRLGTESLNPIYIPCLKGLLATDYCLGIIGGRPRHSLYFLGFQDDKMIHLDPHFCQDTIDTTKRDFPMESFHCTYPRKTALSSMDPSCTLGFYCRTREDFESFTVKILAYLIPPGLDNNYPIFVINPGSREGDYNTSSSVIDH